MIFNLHWAKICSAALYTALKVCALKSELRLYYALKKWTNTLHTKASPKSPDRYYQLSSLISRKALKGYIRMKDKQITVFQRCECNLCFYLNYNKRVLLFHSSIKFESWLFLIFIINPRFSQQNYELLIEV